MEDNKRIVKLGGVCGIAGTVIFVGITFILETFWWQKIPAETIQDRLMVLGSRPHSQINMAGHLMIGFAMVLFIMAFIGLASLLDGVGPQWSSRIGSLLGIIACPIGAIEMVVQGTIMVRMGRMFVVATEEAQRQSIAILYRGLRNFDIGIDLAFDMFFFTAWILLAFSMLKNRQFGKLFGATGIILFGITAVLNISSAPNPPSFEMSPIDALWGLAVSIQMLRLAKSIGIK